MEDENVFELLPAQVEVGRPAVVDEHAKLDLHLLARDHLRQIKAVSVLFAGHSLACVVMQAV